jgi:type I restriction enzyme S subunit
VAVKWLDIKLGEVLTLQRGFDLPASDRRPGRFPVVASTGVVGTHCEAIVKGPGVVIGRSGSLGGAQYVTEDFWPLNTTLWVKDFKGNHRRFCYYLLKSLDLQTFNVGSGVPTLNRNHVHPLPVHVPADVSEQRAIAHVLGTLDDKIELNRQMNETLEAMARALFKSWFVDFDPVHAKAEGRDPGLPADIAALFPDSFEDSALGPIPTGWAVDTLNDVVDVVLGGDWGKSDEDGNGLTPVRCIRGADIPDLQTGGTGKMPVRFLESSSLEKRSLDEGSIVVEISGGSPTQSTGRPVLVSRGLLSRLDKPLVCSNFCRFLKLSRPEQSRFVYLWLRWLYSGDTFLQFENGTTGIKNLAFTRFCSDYRFCMPPLDVLGAFDRHVSPLFEKQQAAAAESDTLAALRDSLLPKFISGELRVFDAVSRGEGIQ